MGTTCVAPGCNSGNPNCTDKVNFHRFPKDKHLKSLWISKIPLIGWKWKKGSRLCSKHFLPNDYKRGSTDSNNRRRKLLKGETIKKKLLNVDAVPSIWPNLPSHLSKVPATPRPTKLSLSICREENASAMKMKKDTFADFRELQEKAIDVPSGVITCFEVVAISFLKVIIDDRPRIQYCVRIRDSLEYEIWYQNAKITVPDLMHDTSSPPEKLTSFSLLKRILFALEEKKDTRSNERKVEVIVEELSKLSEENKKIGFLCEQLSLVFKQPHGRRYSNDLLAMACLWQNISPAMYKQIQSDDVLTLPSHKYVKRLASAITVEFDLSDATIAYLEARKEKLALKDLNINIVLDEVYVQQYVQYSNGAFYGNENNQVTKTLLGVMIKSVGGSYRDVVSMSPMADTNCDKIYKVWKNVVMKTTELGFNVVATTADGHKSNMKMFKKLLCPGHLQSSITNPFDENGKIFLLFDPTHLLKCVYNNLRKKECFVCPDFSDNEGQSESASANIYPNFAHIKQLQNIEIGKPVKIAHKLSDKVINPLALEKTDVSLADAVFHETTINALSEYGKSIPCFLQTARFLRIIRDWWDRFNVKSKDKGHHKRKESMKPIDRENIEEFSASMKKFADWLTLWQEEYPDFCVSSATYQALHQTVTATVDLCYYLLENENGINYIMLGILQQDCLEGRYGWYRQLSGANYYCSVLQFLQAEKSIRLRCLVKSGYNLAEIKEIFETVELNKTVALQQQSITYLEMLSDFTFSKPPNNVSITYYVAGYVSRGLTKKSKCEDCHKNLSKNRQSLSVRIDEDAVTAEELEAGNAFLNAVNRGGLMKPSNLVFITCMHAADLYQFIRQDEKLSKVVLGSANARSLFVEVFLSKLEEMECTNAILRVKCVSGHSFKDHARQIAATMFNLFAKNLATEYNSIIHSNRKRKGKSTEKRDSSSMKAKKLKSEG